MAKRKTNGLATAADFREAQRFGEPEPVRLPKLGKSVLLRRPTPEWFIFRQARLPVTLLAKNGAKEQLTPGQIVEAAKWMYEGLQAIMVQPKLSLNPGPDEISPDMIDIEDAQFMLRWAQGEVIDEAASLETFRGERPTPHPGKHG
jgi:hypothetical protein